MSLSDCYRTIVLTESQEAAALKLKEGPVLLAYLDCGKIRMETEDGEDPYVWRHDQWMPMNEE